MQNIYTIHDMASKTYLKPFVFTSDRDAIEGFSYVCNDSETQYSRHPEDFNLISLGSFDERTGLLTVLDEKSIIARAVEMKKSVPTPTSIIKELDNE